MFWVKMYVDDYFHPDIGNEDPVLSYSSNFQFADEPGQNDDPDPEESSTVPVSSRALPTSTSSVLQPQTVTVTVHDVTSPSGATPTTPFNASVTGPTDRNTSSEGLPSNGAAAKVARMLPTFILLLLGII